MAKKRRLHIYPQLIIMYNSVKTQNQNNIRPNMGLMSLEVRLNKISDIDVFLYNNYFLLFLVATSSYSYSPNLTLIKNIKSNMYRFQLLRFQVILDVDSLKTSTNVSVTIFIGIKKLPV